MSVIASTPRGSISSGQRRLALGTIALSTFFLGTAELAVVGVLDQIANELKASVDSAGLLVSAYAIGIAVGGPLLSLALNTRRRRDAMTACLAIFVLAGIGMASFATLAMLVVTRWLMGAAHGAFVGTASIVAASVAEPGGEARAIAYVVGGVAVSTVVGVPLGAVIAQAFGWRAMVWLIVGGTLLSCVILFRVAAAPERQPPGARTRIRAALGRPLLPVYGLAALVFAGEFVTLAYLGPYLKAAVHATNQQVVAWLFAFGVATAVGTMAGGRMASSIGGRTLPLYTAVLGLAQATLFFATGDTALSLLALLAWGLAAFGIVPALQLRVIQLAEGASDLAATLTASALNLGIAIGSLVGGKVLSASRIDNLTLAGALICLLAFAVAWPLRRDPATLRTTSDTALDS
jgi:DHA1 family inner membrane transport protein